MLSRLKISSRHIFWGEVGRMQKFYTNDIALGHFLGLRDMSTRHFYCCFPSWNSRLEALKVPQKYHPNFFFTEVLRFLSPGAGLGLGRSRGSQIQECSALGEFPEFECWCNGRLGY